MKPELGLPFCIDDLTANHQRLEYPMKDICLTFGISRPFGKK